MSQFPLGRPRVTFIGTVLIGDYQGFQFSFAGLKSMCPFFSLSGISLVVNGKLKMHKGCHFHRASKSEAKKVYPELTQTIKDNIISALIKVEAMRHEKKLKENLYIIGTICKGKYAGTQFSFAQLKDAPLFFNVPNIVRVLNGLMHHYRGCCFRKGSYEEAKPYLNNFTDDVANDLKMMFQPSTHIWAIPVRGQYKGVHFFLNDKKKIQSLFSSQAIYKILLGVNKEHLGFTFKTVDPNDKIDHSKQTLTQEIFYEVQSTLATCFICTLLEPPYKGVEVGFVDKRTVNRYFTINSVRRVLSGRYSKYKRCHFRTASYEEAAAKKDNLTSDIIEYLS